MTRRQSLIGILVVLFSFAYRPGNARSRRVDRERGTLYRTRSLLPHGKSGSKVGTEAGKADKKTKSSGGSYITLDVVDLTQYGRAEDDSKYWTQHSCKEKRRSGTGKGASCSPSSHPTVSPAPTISLDPSASPTDSTAPLVLQKSDQLSTGSTSPTTNFYGNLGTADRNSVVSPSVSPTEIPSVGPTEIPSVGPTESPSVGPTDDPTVNPSTDPTLLTSIYTTWSPTVFTTDDPTASSNDYADSSGPIETSGDRSSGSGGYYTILTDDGKGWESHCNTPEPSGTDGGIFREDQLLVFRYLLLINETILENEPVVTEMERRIHEGLVDHFLVCRVEDNEYPFYVWSIFSAPPDVVNSDPCDEELLLAHIPNPPSESRCVVVQAELKMEVYFPPLRRRLEPMSVTDADPQVVAASTVYLNTSMNRGDFDDGHTVLDAHLVAFVVEDSSHSTLDLGTGTTVAGANTQLQGNEGDSRVVAGAMAMAAATACLIAILFLAARRRRERSEAYQNRIDDLTAYSDLNKDAFERTTYIVGDGDDNSLDWFHDEASSRPGKDLQLLTTIPFDYQQDVHKCASAYCNCHRLDAIRPKFLPPGSLNGGLDGVLDDLRGEHPVLEERSYSSPDTIDL